jgi:hypothetical protein
VRQAEVPVADVRESFLFRYMHHVVYRRRLSSGNIVTVM